MSNSDGSCKTIEQNDAFMRYQNLSNAVALCNSNNVLQLKKELKTIDLFSARFIN